jgi:hypothetical protein
MLKMIDPGVLFKCMISMNLTDSDVLLNPLLTPKSQKSFLNMIDMAKENRNLELETRITFKNEHRLYSLCLVNQTIGRKYDSIPVIKAFGSNGFRTTYMNLGSDLMYEKTQIKKEVETFSMDVRKVKSEDETFFLYDQVQQVKVSLSSERDVNMVPTENMDEDSKEKLMKKYLMSYGVTDIDKALESLKKIDWKPFNRILGEDLGSIENIPFEHNIRYDYQKRYVINSMSLFWRVDVIEYASSEIWQEAEERLDAGPSNIKDEDGSYRKGLGARTRIEIEFDPAAYYTDFLKFYEENPSQEAFMTMVKLLGLNPEDYVKKTKKEAAEDFKIVIDNYIDILLKSDSKEILLDFMKVFSSILNAFYY